MFGLSSEDIIGLFLVVIGIVVGISAAAGWMPSRYRIFAVATAFGLVIVGFAMPALITTPQQIVSAPSTSVAVSSLTATSTGTTVTSALEVQVAAVLNVTGTSPSFTKGTPASGQITFHFILQRTDTLNQAAVFTISLTQPEITNATTSGSDSYLITTPTSNNTPQITIQTPGGITQHGATALVSISAAGTALVNVTADLSAQALANMKEYNTENFQLSIENGPTIIVAVVLAGYT